MAKFKDERYKAIKLYIEAGEAETLLDVFKIIPRTTISKDSGINYSRFTKKIANPDKFLVKEIRILADLFSVDEHLIYTLIQGLYKKKKKPQ